MIEVPSLLADAILAAQKANQDLYEAYLTGDWELIEQRLREWKAAARRRLELTPPPWNGATST
jgi:hypothetical protein